MCIVNSKVVVTRVHTKALYELRDIASRRVREYNRAPAAVPLDWASRSTKLKMSARPIDAVVYRMPTCMSRRAREKQPADQSDYQRQRVNGLENYRGA